MIEFESPSEDDPPVSVRVDGRAWRRIADLMQAGADAEVFALDEETGRLRFGDGLHGKRPPDGASIEAAFRMKPVSPGGQAFDGVKRVRFFTGKLLSADDLNREQEYVNQKRFLHNRLLHGYGVATGLSVHVTDAGASQSVTVGAGLAIDRSGRDLRLAAPLTASLGAASPPLYVVLDYCERATDPAPQPSGPPEPTRIEEGVTLRVVSEAQTGDGVPVARLVGAGTAWAVDASYDRPACRCAP